MGTLEVWLGAAGTGKSARVAGEIAREVARKPLGPPVYWVVPDDATFATERMLLQQTGALLRAEVLTFDRLAERVLAETGQHAGAEVNRTGKRLILAAVYGELRDRLRVMRRPEPSVRFLDAVLAAFREFARAVTGEQEAWWHADAERWPEKLRDLVTLCRGYRDALAQRGLLDPDCRVSAALSSLAAWPRLREASVYFDGFADLYPAELAFVLAVAGRARRTVVTLSADPRWTERRDWMDRPGAREGWVRLPAAVYAPHTLALYAELCREAARRGLTVRTVHLDRPLRFETPDLRHLLGLWRLEEDASEPRDAAQPSSGHLCIAAAPSVRAEADGVAREILRLVRDAGLSWRDCAVIAPALDTYAPYLRDSLEKHQIPFYLDLPRPLALHPLSRFILAALDVAETGWSLEAAVRLFKTRLAGLRQADADWLEQYVRRHEVDGVSAWRSPRPWAFAWNQRSERDDQALLRANDRRADELRRLVAGRVLPFTEAVAADVIEPSALARALWHLLVQADARRTVASWMASEEGAETPAGASLNEQAWLKVTAILDDLAEGGCDTPLPRRYLFTLLRRALTEQGLAGLMAGADQVLVTEAPRAEAFDAQAVFVVGAADGALPWRVRDAGVLDDEDVAWLRAALGVRAGRSRAEREAQARRGLYQVITRARSRLYLSCPLADAEGKAVQPSRWLDEVRRVFGGKGLREDWWDRSDADTAGPPPAPEPTLEWVAAGVRRAVHQHSDAILEAPAFRGAVEALARDAVQRPRLRSVLCGARHGPQAPPIGSALARRLYGDHPAVSVSQLETFAACPYRHFAAYGLRVREEETAEPSAAARGTLIHEAVREFVSRMAEDVPRWRRLTADEVTREMRAAFEAVLLRPDGARWTRRALRRRQAEAVWPVLATAAEVLTEHARYGTFQPAALELAFGDGEALPAFDVRLSNGAELRLRGRIDRVDAVQTPETLFRIVDYKSGAVTLDLSKVAHGLQLQLPVYAAVVERFAANLFGAPGRAVALLYLPLVRSLKTANVPDDPAAARSRAIHAMQSRGLLIYDDAVIEATDVRLLAGGSTPVLRQVYRQDGTLAQRAPVLTNRQWRMLLGRAMAHVLELGERMAAGEIAISPYRLGRDESACSHCPYPALCHLEPRWHGELLRRLDGYDLDRAEQEWEPFADAWDGLLRDPGERAVDAR